MLATFSTVLERERVIVLPGLASVCVTGLPYNRRPWRSRSRNTRSSSAFSAPVLAPPYLDRVRQSMYLFLRATPLFEPSLIVLRGWAGGRPAAAFRVTSQACPYLACPSVLQNCVALSVPIQTETPGRVLSVGESVVSGPFGLLCASW